MQDLMTQVMPKMHGEKFTRMVADDYEVAGYICHYPGACTTAALGLIMSPDILVVAPGGLHTSLLKTSPNLKLITPERARNELPTPKPACLLVMHVSAKEGMVSVVLRRKGSAA